MAIGIQTAHANNVVVDMSQVQDYNQYQMDLQQCEALAVQNQPDAPQREAAAGTAVRGAAAGAVSGGSGSKAAKKGAGVGVIAAASRNRRAASANASAQADQIVKNCMRERGYNVLKKRLSLWRGRLPTALLTGWADTSAGLPFTKLGVAQAHRRPTRVFS